MFYFIAGVLVISLGITFAATLFAFVTTTPIIGYFAGSSTFLTYLGWFSGLVFVMALILALSFLILRLFTNYRLKSKFRNSLIGTGLVSLILFIFCALCHLPNYAEYAEIRENSEYTIDSEKVIVEQSYINSDDFSFNYIMGDNFRINSKKLYSQDVIVYIYKTEGDKVLIEKELSSHGRSSTEARNLAENAIIEATIIDNRIIIPEEFEIRRGKKFRGQDVRFNIYIPKNKEVEIDKSMNRWTIRKNEFRQVREKKSKKVKVIEQIEKKEIPVLEGEIRQENNQD